MSYAKHFYVERAMQEINFSISDAGNGADLVIAFAAFVAKKHSMSPSVSVAEALAGDDIPAAVKEFIVGEGAKWASLSLSSFEKVSAEDIKNYITDKIAERNERLGFAHGAVQNQPDTLNILNAGILDIKADDSVLDLGTGFAAFPIYVANHYSYKKLEGIEINAKTRLYASLLTYLAGFEIVITLGDVLKLSAAKKYNKIHAFPDLNADTTLSFIDKICELLADNGRAVVLLGQSFLFDESRSRKEERQKLIEGGFVEAVIELPVGVLQPFAGVNTCLLVLSKNNKSLRMVDASDFHEKTRRGASSLTADAAEAIVKFIGQDSDKSRRLDYAEIKAKDYYLGSRAYFLEEKISLSGVDNYVKLSDLLEGKIMRGAQIKASELEELGSDEDTGLYYAFAKDIKDNSLASDLKPLKEIDKKLENIALKEGDLLLVMAMTETLKVACVEKLEGRKIIPASNIYIIRLDKSKILPTFFKMLLETEQAFKNFDAFTSGTAIRAISVDYLNKLQIPLPALEVQNELVKKYRIIEDESESLKKRLAALAKEKGEVLASLF